MCRWEKIKASTLNLRENALPISMLPMGRTSELLRLFYVCFMLSYWVPANKS